MKSVFWSLPHQGRQLCSGLLPSPSRLCWPCDVLDGHVPSPGPEPALQPSAHVWSVGRHPPVWVIYGGELWSSVRALLTAETLHIALPSCKLQPGRRPGGSTHTLPAPGSTTQEDKPSCKRRSWLEMSHACTQRGLNPQLLPVSGWAHTTSSTRLFL